MAGANDFTGKFISSTYQRVLQLSGSGEITDGTGSLVSFLPISTSYALTASYVIGGGGPGGPETDPIFTAKSASLATTGSNNFIGNQIITGSLIVSNSLDTTNRYLIKSDGNIQLDWETGLFYDGQGTGSINTVFDLSNRVLKSVNGASIDLGFISFFDQYGSSSISWDAGFRQLYDQNSNTALQWDNTSSNNGVRLYGTASYALTASYTTFNPYIVTIGTRVYTDDTFITAGFKGYKHVGYNSTIVKTRTVANTNGNITIDVKRSGTVLGTLSLVNQSSSLDTTLSGWTTQLNTDDLLEFHVSQSSTYITDISIFIDIQARQ